MKPKLLLLAMSLLCSLREYILSYLLGLPSTSHRLRSHLRTLELPMQSPHPYRFVIVRVLSAPSLNGAVHGTYATPVFRAQAMVVRVAVLHIPNTLSSSYLRVSL